MFRNLITAVLILAIGNCVLAQSAARKVNVGYIYPAGGQQGTTLTAIAGGQYLRGTSQVLVSGDGVTANTKLFGQPVRSINGEKRQLLLKKFNDLRKIRIAEFTGKAPETEQIDRRYEAALKKMEKELSNPDLTEKERKKVENYYTIPEHPYLDGIEDMSLRELEHIRSIVTFPRNKTQDNRQIGEFMQLEIAIAKDAKPGPREIRFVTGTSISDPIIFQVDTVHEVTELEPNNKTAIPEKIGNTPLPPMDTVKLPAVLNGQIMPGDVDRFRFRAERGQKLVIEAYARSLTPYLADAVPGWFQATLALYDANGKEVAYTDDFMFNPDPVMLFDVKQTGDYELEIRDSIYRGREDFVYRVKVGEQPFITSIFPLGGTEGKEIKAELHGWNLPVETVTLDTSKADGAIKKICCDKDNLFSNCVSYCVSDISEIVEKENNNNLENAEPVSLPTIVNGLIDNSGDIDIFRFNGKAGDTVALEVMGRRLNSPVDSIIKLLDKDGTVIAVNDDYVEKDQHLYLDTTGLTTHHADSIMTAELPADGKYYVCIADSQNQGGLDYGYRLRMSAPEPDFSLRTNISSAQVNCGGIIAFTIFAMRKDGFDGEINIELKDPVQGFNLTGGTIPPGCDKVCVTISTPPLRPTQIYNLKLIGWTKVNNKMVIRPVVPADDSMQAFLYRHLVPADNFVLQVIKNKWPIPPVEILNTPIELTPGESKVVIAKTKKRAVLDEIKLQLRDNPDGLTISDVKVVKQGLSFILTANADEMKSGYQGNLLIEGIREYYPKDKNGKVAKTAKTYSMGYLPAVPIRVKN